MRLSGALVLSNACFFAMMSKPILTISVVFLIHSYHYWLLGEINCYFLEYILGKIWWSCGLNLSKIKETAFWLSVSKSIHLISVSIGGLYRHLHFTFHVHKEQYLPRKKTEEDTYFSQFTIERSSESFENSLLSTIVCNCMLNNSSFLISHAKLRIVFDTANSLIATKD